MGSPIG